ncbi:hypothetical protein IEQ34_017906 [Dendrobium chrysotoxum]|uniref:Uncharacterized protein n=1 Tax=Dendrobium chrysotoxum TaxID=161865 RepID=A0AAV7GBG0_DENCH|nr:hypothetical protein IEQ34_017906 [Dendrobium chrysotoxum]
MKKLYFDKGAAKKSLSSFLDDGEIFLEAERMIKKPKSMNESLPECNLSKIQPAKVTNITSTHDGGKQKKSDNDIYKCQEKASQSSYHSFTMHQVNAAYIQVSASRFRGGLKHSTGPNSASRNSTHSSPIPSSEILKPPTNQIQVLL